MGFEPTALNTKTEIGLQMREDHLAPLLLALYRSRPLFLLYMVWI